MLERNESNEKKQSRWTVLPLEEPRLDKKRNLGLRVYEGSRMRGNSPQHYMSNLAWFTRVLWWNGLPWQSTGQSIRLIQVKVRNARWKRVASNTSANDRMRMPWPWTGQATRELQWTHVAAARVESAHAPSGSGTSTIGIDPRTKRQRHEHEWNRPTHQATRQATRLRTVARHDGAIARAWPAQARRLASRDALESRHGSP